MKACVLKLIRYLFLRLRTCSTDIDVIIFSNNIDQYYSEDYDRLVDDPCLIFKYCIIDFGWY